VRSVYIACAFASWDARCGLRLFCASSASAAKALMWNHRSSTRIAMIHQKSQVLSKKVSISKIPYWLQDKYTIMSIHIL